MSLVQGDYGNLIHGVSQQPDERMAKGQVREQINCRSHLTKGLASRAGFEFIGILTPDVDNGGSLENAKWTVQERGDGKVSIIAYDITRPAPFDLLATLKPFSFLGASEAYYNSGITDPSQQLSIDSVLDTTFLTNRTVVPTGENALDIITEPSRVTWIEFKTLQTGTEIEITFATIAGGDYTTQVFDGFVTIDPSDGVPDPIQSARTREYEGSYHAEQFVIQAASVNVTSYNNWVRIGEPDANGITIVKGGESILLYENRSIESIEKLPSFAIAGDIAVVESAKDEEKDLGYFLATKRNDNVGFGEVAWNETVGTGTVGEFTDTTMPHRLLRDLSDNFTLEVIPWVERQVGDKETNPYPSFIESSTPISNVGIFQNRLFLASNETVFLSASDSFFDLWRESAFYKTDADPFEVFADTDKLNIIKYAEAFDGDLIFFSDNGQFILSGDINQTYATASIGAVSQFKANLLATPVLSGDNIFFATDYGNFVGVRELYIDGTDATKRALPITEHVDEYISGNFVHMATSTNLNALCSLTNDKLDEVYVYEWKRNVNRELQQQAWHKWKMQSGVEVEWLGFIASRLYAVMKVITPSGTEHHLWDLAWDDPAKTHGLSFALIMDGRFEIDGGDIAYDAGTMTSSWSTPYDREDLVFVEGVESPDAGFEVDAVRTGVNTWEAVNADLRGIKLIAGLKFDRVVELPTPQVRDQNGVAKTVDRLQLSKMFMHFSKVGQMVMTITDAHGRDKRITYNNRRVGLPTNQPSYINTDSDTWNFGVRKKTKGLTMTLSSNDITPFELRAIEWRGDFKQKGRRV
tara:strand:+ start:32745 stop:35174 length:2430 start_codon:yes stop_codon:yes gene_type:complete